MSERLPPINATLVGAFNPAIFQPDWVRANLSGFEGQVEQFLTAQPSAPPLLRTTDDLYLLVTGERIVVYGDAQRVGTAAAEVLRTLYHTPLRAAGLNFQFQGRHEPERCAPWAIAADPTRVRDVLRGEPGGIGFNHVARRSDGVQVTVKLSWPSASEPDLLLELNYHLSATGGVGKGRAEELAAHTQRAAEFEADANRILQEILRG